MMDATEQRAKVRRVLAALKAGADYGEAAASVGMETSYASRIHRVQLQGTRALFEAMQTGRLSVNGAYRLLKASPKRQNAVAADPMIARKRRKPLSPEVRARISATAKARWADPLGARRF
jgi:hypothetical protein